jgi:uncharacterized OB-fold protein
MNKRPVPRHPKTDCPDAGKVYPSSSAECPKCGQALTRDEFLGENPEVKA